MIQLRDYQVNAVERLLAETEVLLRSPENEICVFQAPTGSGKTLIVAEYLRRLIRQKNRPALSFIWISVRKLHEQSKDKLEKYYENDRLLRCSYFEDLEDKKIAENEILFINWHSINKKDINIYVRENELENNLNSIIRNTKEEGREILLIIDESHHTASAEKSRELIAVISSKITLEVSATPHLKEGTSAIVKVNLAAVKDEEMIKSEIAVNPEFMRLKVGARSADELVIEQAIKKREELKEMYKAERSNVNPLVLVQLPDKGKGVDDRKEEVREILARKFNISENNGRLAIWLSEDKSDTLPNIEKNGNEVEVLLFKQAIALGWDCPRASILVIFRELKSFTFTIQTIGRIMRMPELHYYTKEPELNKGYVFTNLASIEIAEEYARDYVTLYESKRRNEMYRSIKLSSIYLKRRRERSRLSGDFSKIFNQIAVQRGLKDRITTHPSKIVDPVIADGKIVNIDKVGEVEHAGTIHVALTDIELQARFDNFVIANCSPYAPSDSSDRMKTAVYQFLEAECNLGRYGREAQRIVLGKENAQVFMDFINLAKEEYRAQVVQPLSERREVQQVEKWEVPLVIGYNSRYREMTYGRSIMKPLYVRSPSDPESAFMEFLSQTKKVKWWYRNGENEIKYFAVQYKDEGNFDRGFYVDFIVQFNDGRIGLFDTKSGITAKDAGPRAEGLQKYIAGQNKKGKRVCGGILISANGTWRYNDQRKYRYDPNDLSSWKVLEL